MNTLVGVRHSGVGRHAGIRVSSGIETWCTNSFARKVVEAGLALIDLAKTKRPDGLVLFIDRCDSPLLSWTAREDAGECGGNFGWVFVIFCVDREDVIDELILECDADGCELVHHPDKY